MPQKHPAKLRKIKISPAYSRASLILDYTHTSASALLEAFHLAREKRGNPRGMTTDKEQDLLRAMLVMAAAGLDAMLKQLIRDTLPNLIAVDTTVKNGLQKFISRQIQGEGDNPLPKQTKDFFARILAAPSHQKQVITEYISYLIQGSLQSPDELFRIADAFSLEHKVLGTDRKTLKNIFDIRNVIIHELDIDIEAERRSRNVRKINDMISYTNDLLKLAESMRDSVEGKLVSVTPKPI